MIICTKCKTPKESPSFSPDKRTKNGFFPWCRDCKNAWSKEWRQANQTDERKANKSRADRKNYIKHYEQIREHQVWSRLQTRYKLTKEEYEAFIESQNGLCAICRKECKTGQRLVVDHCHKTNKVRGLLCKSCNMHLGVLEKDEWLEKAQTYLRATQ